MFLLNLSLPELVALFGAVSGVVVMLYLLDRHKRRLTVSTLRFWIHSERPVEMKHRRRIQQPWSLLLQILSIALLLLAIAQLRFGSPILAFRDHVLILDTSAWMAAHGTHGRLMDQAKSLARAYLRALPASDRVMIVRADALSTPATAFETNRQTLFDTVRQSEPGSTALNADQAIQFARHALAQAGRAGEIVYVGAGLLAGREAAPTRPVPNLRVLAVNDVVENCGLRKIGLRRSSIDPDIWEIFVSVRNYGSSPRKVPLAVTFGGSPAGARLLNLKPGEDENATFEYRTRAAGWIEARLLAGDAFPDDDRAVLEVPSQRPVRVEVYSTRPDQLRPVLAANPRVQAVFLEPADYKPGTQARIVILDGFTPPEPLSTDAILIEPPRAHSPVAVRTVVSNAALTRWNSDHALGAGLRSKDLRLESSQVFVPLPNDIVVAEVEGGPAILARPGKMKLVALGFHPVRNALRFELSTPLLFANILRWMAPEMFHRWELNGGSVGSVNVALAPEADPASVRVISDNKTALPFTIQGKTLRMFAGTPGTVRILSGDRESVYSLTLPEVGDTHWDYPRDARRGIPRMSVATASSRDLWQWLAILGAIGILAEWLLFGRYRGNIRSRITLPWRKKPPTPGPVRRAS